MRVEAPAGPRTGRRTGARDRAGKRTEPKGEVMRPSTKLLASGIGLLAMALTVALSAGCAHKVGMFSSRLDARIVTSASLNPDPTGRPSPVVVRLYELADRGTFESADFFGIYDNEASTLGTDMLSREELELKPGERREVTHDLDDKTRYLGVVVAYRELDNALWRAVAEIRPGQTNQFTIGVGGQTVSVVKR